MDSTTFEREPRCFRHRPPAAHGRRRSHRFPGAGPPAVHARQTLLCVAAAAVASLGLPSRVVAQFPLAGSVEAQTMVAPASGGVGPGLSADLWAAVSALRIGGFFGVGAVLTDQDAHNRVFMPVGVSIAYDVMGEDLGFSVRLRGGLWGGATQARKITGGGMLGGGAMLLIRVGPAAALQLGVSVQGLLGDAATALVAPAAGFSFWPEPTPALPAFEAASERTAPPPPPPERGKPPSGAAEA